MLSPVRGSSMRSNRKYQLRTNQFLSKKKTRTS